MKLVYPVVIQKEQSKGEKYRIVYVPDIDSYTEGESIGDCINMARDLIGLHCLSLDEDDNKTFPDATPLEDIKCDEDSFVTLVDVDYDEYKKQYSLKTVRRNVTLPSWINYEAEKSGINVSSVLQKALINELHLTPKF